MYKILTSIVAVLFDIIYNVEILGLENVDLNDKLIVSGNHWSNLDPVFVSCFFPKEIHWMAKKELFQNKLFAWFLNKVGVFPVDRERADLSSTKRALQILKDDEILGIFPEGHRVKEIDVNAGKGGAAVIAVRSKAKVLPFYIEGNYKPFSKMKIHFRDTMDFKIEDRKKLTNEDYDYLTKKIMENIYGIGDGNRSISS